MNKSKLIFNALGFQLGWWLCVLGVKYNLPLLGPVYMLLFLGIHYTIYKNRNEFLLILFAGVIGTLIDSVYTGAGLLSYKGGYEHAWLAPLWITAMWAGFTATLNSSLKWLDKSPVLGFIAGAIFGPLSYFSGEKLGVISIEWSWPVAALILSFVWGSAILLLFKMNERMGVVQS